MRDSIRPDLEAALKSQAAQDAGLIYTDPQDTRVVTTRVVDGVKEPASPVYLMWGGRSQAGVRSRFLREVVQVVVIFGPMQTKDPWTRADTAIDAALEIIYTVPGTFPELLPITPTEIAPGGRDSRGRDSRGGGKTYAAAVIQVVGP